MVSVAEVWRCVNGFGGIYEVSNLGNVRSVERLANHWRGTKRKMKGKLLKPILHRGYYVVSLLDGTACKKPVHQLVAETFIGKVPGMVVNHINGIKTDNRPENLEYITNSENVLHAHRTGLMPQTRKAS